MFPGAFAASSYTLDSAGDRFVTMHMIRKGQMHRPTGSTVSAADQFYSLAA